MFIFCIANVKRIPTWKNVKQNLYQSNKIDLYALFSTFVCQTIFANKSDVLSSEMAFNIFNLFSLFWRNELAETEKRSLLVLLCS